MEEKIIGGIPLSKWKKAFKDAVGIAIDKDYFSDILLYDLYPHSSEEGKWGYVYEAMDAIFGKASN